MKATVAAVLMAMGRRYIWRQNQLSLHSLRLLPAAALLPLRREGLDPVSTLGQVRDQSPISQLPVPFRTRVWLVAGYPEARAVLGDADGFSTDFARLVGDSANTVTQPGGLGFADPPAHTRLRKLLTPEFTMRRLSRLEQPIQDIVAQRLDALESMYAPVDLVDEYALPIPSVVICELLGVPYADRAQFQRMAIARFDVRSGPRRALKAIAQSLDYLGRTVAEQRRRPGDGLIGMIIREHGDDISNDELAGLADGVLTGGFETTASTLALGALTLLTDSMTAALIRDDETAVSPFVEELLRYASVVQVAFPRIARRDTTIEGTTIEKGDIVIVSLSGANRDPRLAVGLETIDPVRAPLSHLAFGHGVHRCVGAELARAELRAALPALVRRYPAARLGIPSNLLRFRKASIVYGVEALPVNLHGIED